MSGEIRDKITGMCQDLGIPVVGFAPADRWDNPPFEPWVPEEFRPRAIYPETKTVIVIGLPVSLPVLETTPSIHYHELYRTVNTLLDMHGYRVAEFLTGIGHPSIWIPRDGYGSIAILKEKPVAFFSHRHAAYLAGLGTFGINNTLLTPEFGPRVRFASIFTSAEIPPDKVLEKNLCIRCMQCVAACPVKALNGKDYPEGLTEKRTCTARSEALANRFISPCGICIKVCPVGADRKRFAREDMGIYHEDDERFSVYHRAWKHVRSYGGR
ncbi:4Fe-4S binding protein [uncultured Methanoregula sp.]|uniref:4Fe-4S binding protein n=1 Tax=uncultured Methanoregula sp. TaxID=1005933 RepID=UPI002AAAA01A|nr:4Fe-4S binding protein [uncultured Methanoregula sp.]